MKKIIGLSAAMVVLGGAAMACPSWENNGATASFTGSGLRNGGTNLEVVAGGSERLRGCGINFGSDSGDGSVQRDPDFTFEISGLANKQLVFSTYSECDSVLVINTGNANWFYDDDDNTASSLDARIILTRPRDGIYDVWIGTHDGSYCDAYLNVQTISR